MALSDYRSRIIPFTFTAPSGATFLLSYDKVDREGGKKASVNEVLDSDVSITQDQGGTAERIPVECYFTGEDYDLVADGFYAALSERYTLEDPGFLLHPRWGLIEVFPLKWKQSENFVSGSRRANFTIEFIRVYPLGGIFEAITKGISQVVQLLSLLKSGFFESFLLNTVENIQSIGATLQASLDTVKSDILGLTSNHTDLSDRINNIYLDASDLISDVGSNVDIVISQIQDILQIPVLLEDATFSKINNYTSTINSLITDNSNVSDISNEIKKNKAMTYERLTGFAFACQCASSLYTDFKTREDAIKAIEILDESYSLFTTNLNDYKVNSNLETSFAGDYEFLNNLHEIYRLSVALLLEKSFSLAREFSIVLNEISDPVTLCYEYYGKVDNETLNFFFESNNISNSEFIELDKGSEVVFYAN